MIAHQDSLFLAVASYGFETLSTIWDINSKNGVDHIVKDVVTVGNSPSPNCVIDIFLTYIRIL